MFTGIIEEVGRVGRSARREDVLVVRLEAPRTAEGLSPGDSVAVNGCCLTAVEVAAAGFSCELTGETLRRTAAESRLLPGRAVNLERPLRCNGRFDGHIVQGHVDGVGRILDVSPGALSRELLLEAPEGLSRYLVEKGSLAVDGISLTVARLAARTFTVAIIPYTLEQTSLRDARAGDLVNLEVDIIAKYVERLLAAAGLAAG